MKDPGEKETAALAKKSLAIPKPLRLLGEDGRIHLPAVPDKFYLGWIYLFKESRRGK